MARRRRTKPKTEVAEAAEKRLDENAAQELQTAVSGLQAALLSEASKVAKGDRITVEDLKRAFDRLSHPSREQIGLVDAQAVVSPSSTP
ncbi:MAG: hypothetical protein KY475_03630 [Planctomycetes bacterium]|nr:hypothetical protein [Planctomycetota bacterium]